YRITPNISICIQTTRPTNRIALQIPARSWVIRPVAGIPKPGFLVPVLPRKSKVQSADAVQSHLPVECIVARAPDDGFRAVGHDLGPPQMIAVDHQKLVALHAGHRDTAHPQVVRPCTQVLAQHLATWSVGEPVVGSRSGTLVHPLTECVDRV